MKVNFDYKELGNFGLRKSQISFWLNTKRGNKIYSQQFRQLIEEGKSDRCTFEAKIFYKLRGLLTMLEKQIETGYLTELVGDYCRWIPRQRKLTKNTWITDKRIDGIV